MFAYAQERNSLGGKQPQIILRRNLNIHECSAIAVKAVTAAQLAMASMGVYSVTLDEGKQHEGLRQK